ncbi:unnamed protein product [Pylaiella littoralis]
MSKSMAAATFHKFCKNFAKEMFEEHIYLPTGTYQDEVMDCYRKLGFTGAIGSTDVTYVGWGMCPFTLGRSFTGKEGFPTLAFEVTVDHAGRAIGVTPRVHRCDQRQDDRPLRRSRTDHQEQQSVQGSKVQAQEGGWHGVHPERMLFDRRQRLSRVGHPLGPIEVPG